MSITHLYCLVCLRCNNRGKCWVTITYFVQPKEIEIELNKNLSKKPFFVLMLSGLLIQKLNKISWVQDCDGAWALRYESESCVPYVVLTA